VLNSVDLVGGPCRYYHYRRHGQAGYYSFDDPQVEVMDEDGDSREATG